MTEPNERLSSLRASIDAALAARSLPGPDDRQALRLFSGFYEGYPALTIDLYGRTLMLLDHSDDGDEEAARAALALLTERIPWLKAAVWKIRKARDHRANAGHLLLGAEGDLDDRILEDGVWYALDLRLNHDASFYLDTRELRAWARQNLAGRTVLNAFAYTGSLGVAALAGGASRVVQLDRSKPFLDVARRSYALNRFALRRGDFVTADFFEHVGRLKKQNELFGAAIIDPPFFSTTQSGRVDLVQESHRVLNKVRPVLGDGALLIAVNNALYLSGASYMKLLGELCSDGYLSLERTLAVPPDVAPSTRLRQPPADPAPFNHTTKIAVLRVRRKDGRTA